MAALTTSAVSILVFEESFQGQTDIPNEVQWFEAKNINQSYQTFFNHAIDIVLTADAKLPPALETFLKKSQLTPLIADLHTPLTKIYTAWDHQKLAQKNVSLNNQFELLVQYGEWTGPQNQINDIDSVQLVCPPGAETEAAALSLHLKSPRNGQPFEIYRLSGQSDQQIEQDLWGYFWPEEPPYIQKGMLNQNGTLLLIDANRLSVALQQKLLKELKNIKKRILVSSPIPLLSLAQNNLFSKELAEYFSKQVLPLTALEDRLEELPMIADQILARLNKKFHLQVNPLSTDVIQFLSTQNFSNGYKELEAVLTLAALKRQKGQLTPEHFKRS